MRSGAGGWYSSPGGTSRLATAGCCWLRSAVSLHQGWSYLAVRLVPLWPHMHQHLCRRRGHTPPQAAGVDRVDMRPATCEQGPCRAAAHFGAGDGAHPTCTPSRPACIQSWHAQFQQRLHRTPLHGRPQLLRILLPRAACCASLRCTAVLRRRLHIGRRFGAAGAWQRAARLRLLVCALLALHLLLSLACCACRRWRHLVDQRHTAKIACLVHLPAGTEEAGPAARGS